MVASRSGTRHPRSSPPKVYATRKRSGKLGFSTSYTFSSSSPSQDGEDGDLVDVAPSMTTFAANPPPPLAVTMSPHNAHNRPKPQSHQQVDDDDSYEDQPNKKKSRRAKPSTSNLNPRRASMGGQANKSKPGRPKRRATTPGEPSQYEPAENPNTPDITEADEIENLEPNNVSKASLIRIAEAWEKRAPQI
jgi:hypothetical protein